jgi:hypothetical protein
MTAAVAAASVLDARTPDLRLVPQPGAGASRQCFVLAPALTELLELRLRRHAADGANH